MTGSLAAFQTDLGLALRGEDTCPIDPQSAGFRFTMTVRRSWREGRVITAARALMTVIPEAQRQRLLDEYLEQRGGLEVFLEREAEAFLMFLASRLPAPSHELTICQMHQALIRARAGAAAFATPVDVAGTAPVRQGRHASLVWFHADPSAVVAALGGGTLPPVGPPAHAVLFAPGLPDLFRSATGAEARLWAALPTANAPRALIAPLLAEGVLEFTDSAERAFVVSGGI